MATSTSAGGLSPAATAMANDHDPFISKDNSPVEREPRHRYSTFDSHLFALGSDASPAQAKRALEAHLAETDRRMEEAGKLGTALVQQRKELTQRLEEVENLQAEGELSQDLKQKLVEIEKDYNDVARESARAFLPKPRVPSNEAAAGSPFVPEGKGGRRSVSPSKFEAQATGSPTKLSVPNRKLRNQPANRVHDIEFAAEISQSLIVQVRNLQSLLAEREEELRDVKLEKSKLEYDAEGFQQRVKTLDESQNRYKDENWSLETQVHELSAAQREASDREKKLQQTVSILQAEKNSAQRELDEVKLGHAKLSEEHAAAVKYHDTELGAAKRNIVIADSERAALLRKVEDLTGQNQELAKAVSSQRGRTFDRQEILGTTDEDFETANDNNTPEHSPPPSPVKGTPRHSLLESETLKTSLQHAQRTIQSLRTNVHREKTEKLELRRMLQDARDELEKVRSDPMPTSKRASKTTTRDFKKPPRLLGGLRSARSEVFAEDPDWEDQTVSSSPAPSILSRRRSSGFAPVIESVEQENFETANETSDQAFETANERGTETDDFHTGAEEFSSDDAQTETDSPTKRRTLRGRPPSLPMGLTRSGSVDSTASTEDEYGFDEMRTPTSQLPQLQAKFPLRVSRGAFRRSRQASEDATFQSSPAGLPGSAGGTPQPVQSLAAELGDFDGSDNESNLSATPSRRSIHLSRPGSIRGTTASPPPPVPRLSRAPMVDSGTMTEPVPDSTLFIPSSGVAHERPMSMNTVISGVSDYSDAGTLNMEENLAKFPSPPTSPPKREFSLSDVHAHDLSPVEQPDHHQAELESLRHEHAKQIEELHAEKSAAHAAVLADLEAQHTDTVARAIDQARTSHQHELEILKSDHADDKTRAVAESKAAHVQELESLHAAHLEKVAQMDLHHHAAHAAELEALKSTHAEHLQSSKKASDEAHAAELGNLITAHAAQIELAKKQLNDSHARELDSLRHAHDALIEEAKNNSDATHAKELESLKAAHLAQIETTKDMISASHMQELEALKGAHGSQVEQSKKDSDMSHAAEIAALAALHTQQLLTSKTDNEAKFAKELESLKSSHSQQLDSFKADADHHLAKQVDELKAAHLDELNASRTQSGAKLAAELDALKLAHGKILESSKADAENKLAQEVHTLQAEHMKQVEDIRTQEAANLSREIESLKAHHNKELEALATEKDRTHAAEVAALVATHAKQLDDTVAKRDAMHAAELAALTDSHGKQLTASKSEAEATMSRELASLKDSHAHDLETLRNEHAAAHAKELEAFEAALTKQLESSRSEGDAAHNEQIEALKTANIEIVEAHKRDSKKALEQALESMKASHERELESLRSDYATTRSKEIEDLGSKHVGELAALEAAHTAAKAKEIEILSSQHEQSVASLHRENATAKAKELDDLSARYEKQIERMMADAAAAKAKELDELSARYERQIESMKAETAAAKAQELAELTASHQREVEMLHTEATALRERDLQELASRHQREIEDLTTGAAASKEAELETLASRHQDHIVALNAEAASSKAKELDELKASHDSAINSLKDEHGAAITKLGEDLATSHALELENLRSEHEASRTTDLGTLAAKHSIDLEALRQEHEASKIKELEQLKSEHSTFLASLRSEHQNTMDNAIENLKASHAKDIDSLHGSHATSLDTALSTIKSGHAKELADLNAANDAALAHALESANAEHARALEAQHAQSSAERDGLLASHALELETLRKALTVTPPTLGYSPLSTVETEPIAEPEVLRSPKREGFILPRDAEHPQTPPPSAIGTFSKRGKGTVAPIIAEDDTRQSPTATNSPETPESQRPFKEMSTNTDARPTRRQVSPMADHSSQTALTSDGIDKLILKQRRRGSQDSLKIVTEPPQVITTLEDGTPLTVRHSRSQESIASVSRAKGKPGDSSAILAPSPVPVRRPGSSGSARGSQQMMPPLPANHKEVIEAARTGSSHGAKGVMGPPLLPASAYKNPSARPHTPRDRPQSPLSGRGTPTPRFIRTGSAQGHADVQSPTKISARSRQSSVSSFTSEIDNRFNIRGDMGMGVSSFAGPNTDPRMIQAITQTMIGEYLWKYTRKAGRGEMSENRHRRYFWVHPYTRTLYWSDRDPSAAGRSELKAKSIPIEAVRVVTDDNPMPPGLHRKSLIIISPGRTVKFTCTTGQRHETWFNALSYLLLRTGNEGQTDAEEMAGNITQADVDEFNPSYGTRPGIGNRRAPPSLSSYNSRTTRNESPNIDMSMSIPTLTPTNERNTSARPGTLGRLSGYLNRTNTSGSIFSSLRSRSHAPHGHESAIYEASEINDSAEELRQIIEQQDRESDRLENVRACCDGKHDVGTLSRSSKRNRPGHSHTHSHSHSHSHPGQSTTPTPMSTLKARA
ncbi:hypothetical protein AB5N19_08718 [Seiridium cardinale]